MLEIINFDTNYRKVNKHNNLVNNFLRSVNLPTECIDYDNVQLYSKVKTILDSPLVSKSDHKQLMKFCRIWLKHQGNLNNKYQARIQAKTQYYLNKQHNAQMRERRLANKANKQKNNCIN
jgi:hypothetical protein